MVPFSDIHAALAAGDIKKARALLDAATIRYAYGQGPSTWGLEALVSAAEGYVRNPLMRSDATSRFIRPKDRT